MRLTLVILVLLTGCLLFQPEANTDFGVQGEMVGGISAKTLHAKIPRVVRLVRAANTDLSHERAPRRWGLRGDDLRPGSVAVFGMSPLWGRTELLWVAALLILLCLTILALYIRLKLAIDGQQRLSGMLITAQEKERSRLASEIHDDFSQRMALLALGLENAEEAVGTLPDQAVQQIHSLLNSASQIGADLHTLSHRLHSSTLEKLGLVPGVSALCEEFATQHGIEVDFLSDNVSRRIHPQVALCVFRIVQEGLRNSRKHGGAARVEVRLRGGARNLHLSVNDEGTGFDTRELGKKEGLGIRSMEERAFLLGGRFEIHSEQGKGTRVEAWVPLHPSSKLAAG